MRGRWCKCLTRRKRGYERKIQDTRYFTGCELKKRERERGKDEEDLQSMKCLRDEIYVAWLTFTTVHSKYEKGIINMIYQLMKELGQGDQKQG